MKFLAMVLAPLTVFASLSALALSPTNPPKNPCGVAASAPVAYFNDTNAALCAPAPFGTGTVPTVRVNKAGMMVWNYCPSSTGAWQAQWLAGTWATISGASYLADTAAIAAATDPLAQLNSILKTRVTTPIDDPTLTPVWCPFADEMYAGAPKPVSAPASAPAPAPTWVVAKNGTSLTRPSFAVVNGVRSFSSKTTIAVGAPCDLVAIKLVEGRNTYGQVAPGLVAICSQL